MKVITIVNEKGGVAKTTTAVNMSTLLAAKYGKKTLLIDMDKQGNASQHIGIYNDTKECGASRIFYGNMEKPLMTGINGLDAVDANLSLKKAVYDIEKSNNTQHDILKKWLMMQTEYEYAIIDCPPDVNICTINAVCASNEVIIPIKMDNYSVEGTHQLLQQIEQLMGLNQNLKIGGILITNFEKDRKKPENILAAEKWVRTNIRYLVFDTKIRHCTKVPDSSIYKKSMEDYAPKCAAAVDYRKFVKEYLGEESSI